MRESNQPKRDRVAGPRTQNTTKEVSLHEDGRKNRPAFPIFTPLPPIVELSPLKVSPLRISPIKISPSKPSSIGGSSVHISSAKLGLVEMSPTKDGIGRRAYSVDKLAEVKKEKEISSMVSRKVVTSNPVELKPQPKNVGLGLELDKILPAAPSTLESTTTKILPAVPLFSDSTTDISYGKGKEEEKYDGKAEKRSRGGLPSRTAQWVEVDANTKMIRHEEVIAEYGREDSPTLAIGLTPGPRLSPPADFLPGNSPEEKLDGFLDQLYREQVSHSTCSQDNIPTSTSTVYSTVLCIVNVVVGKS